MAREALIAGATGSVGSKLLGEIQASGHYDRVHVLTRRPLGLDGAKVEEHLIDYDDLASWSPPPFSDLFCCLGTTMKKAGSKESFRRVDLGYVTDLGRIAAKAGASMFLVSSLGASAVSTNFYLRTKGEAEEALRALELTRLGIVRPSIMHADRTETRPTEKLSGLLMGLASPLMLGSLRRYRPIHPQTVAKAMLAMAANDFTGTRILESHQIHDLVASKP